ncbi:acyl-CoA dehydrogenase/oxidase [Catenaria anguillulae PL171]|uniref:Acyl-coenzyme A oxidase n=1 Tax=Catenaria anguillulae PL171 TaxID=765915 RepID=A0A1Y2I508_9FUNG|nr:acyl-CoA dehydrogenase/oxidase [Catenaria anguillulae PL171]
MDSSSPSPDASAAAVPITAHQPAIDLAAERARADFDPAAMHEYLLGGGPERVAAKKLAYTLIERDPVLNFFHSGGHHFDLDRPALREKTMAQIRRAIEIRQTLTDSPADQQLAQWLMVCMCELSESFSMRLFVSDALFARSFRMFGTPAQAREWVPRVLRWETIGCFGMTELGTSSNLRSIATTATFDKRSDAFIVHTPDLMATKVWIGAAGETATHTSCLCRVMLDGVDCGLHWIIVPLRDPESGRLLPGVTAGDIGAKAGRQGLDNGWLQFTHVRVPRTNMLSRWARVLPDGSFESGLASDDPARSQVSSQAAATLSYAGLIPERLEITRGVPMAVNQALTIAIRYAAYRRQGPTGNPPILDYVTVQAALLPSLALMHAVMAADGAVWDRWTRMEADPAELVKGLADMHALSAGIKAMVTWRGSDALELVRRSMGGHAYSKYNAVADAIADFGVMTTGGGDNYVMVQQTVRYLLGQVRKVAKGGKVDKESSVGYLNNLAEVHASLDKPPTHISNWSDLDSLHGHLVRLVVAKTASLAADLQSAAADTGASQADAWNAHLLTVCDLAQLHTATYLSRAFCTRVRTAPVALRPVLHDLCQLYLLDTLARAGKDLMMTSTQWPAQLVHELEAQVVASMRKVRPRAVALVDAFGFPDFVLKSPLAAMDGNGYERYLNMMKSAPGQGFGGVPEYHGREIRPLTAPWTKLGAGNRM